MCNFPSQKVFYGIAISNLFHTTLRMALIYLDRDNDEPSLTSRRHPEIHNTGASPKVSVVMNNDCSVTISGDDALRDFSEGSECGTSHAVAGPLVHLPLAILIISNAYSMVPRIDAV